MTPEKLTDEQILQAFNYCFGETQGTCKECPFNKYTGDCCETELQGAAVDLINRLKAENERLEYTLLGVMHFVDKWLDGDELEQDEVNRAEIMRNRTLKIIEEQQAEIDRLKRFKAYFDDLYGTGLSISNWHLNGNLEPFDNFYVSALEEMVGENNV